MAQAQLQDHDQYFDYTCNYMCANKNRVNESIRFCTECIRHMCSSCLETHQAIYKSHSVVDPRTASKYRRNNTITEHCWKHPGKVSDLFCRRHDVVVCSACVPEHHSCGPASYIPEVVNDILHFREIQQTSNQLAELGSELECLTVGENDTRKSDGDNERIVSDIKRYSAELIGMIKHLEDTSLQEVKTTNKAKRKYLHSTVEECSKMTSEMNTCLSNLLSANDNKPQQFVCTKNGQRLVKSAGQLLQKARRTRSENQTCSYIIDRNIRDAFSGFRSLIKERHFLRISPVKKYNVVFQNSNTPDIRGCCLLSDGSVLLSDNTNEELKLFDPSANEVTKALHMPSYPFGVCCVSALEVAVALRNKTIQFACVTPSLTLSRSFKVDHDCYGIAYNSDCLFITDTDTKVYVRKLDGSLLQTITVPGANYAWGIALSPGGELLYVACDTGLACLERSGRPVYTRGAGGVCGGVHVDERKRVVVFDPVSHGVVQVGENGEVLVKLLASSDGISKPQSVCVDCTKKIIYVTQSKNDEIAVASIIALRETDKPN